MKTIGLLGGMSWESTQTYYTLINQGVRARLGGLHSARCVLLSVDFAEIETLQVQGCWQQAGALLAADAQALQRAGADLLLLCTNTMHKVAEVIETAISIPLLHIADATAQAIQTQGLSRIGLLGTRFTMEEDFYRGRLEQRFGLEVIVPESAERDLVHRVIYDELCLGQVCEPSRAAYRQVIAGLAAAGCQGIILGCTEIGLLVKPEDSPVPLFDTTLLHAQAAVEAALRKER